MKRTLNPAALCICTVFTVFLIMGVSREAQSDQKFKKELKQAQFIKNRIIVKFKSEGNQAVEQEIEGVIKNKRSMKEVVRDKSDSLDRLNKKFKVHQARGLFRKEEGLSIAAEKEQRKFERKKIKSKFQARSQRVKESLEADLSNVYVLEVEEGQDMEAMLEEFQADPHVEFVQPDYVMEPNYVSNDPYFSGGNLWGLNKIQMPLAWDKSQGEGIVVAVVDTGVDYLHPDLSANIWRNIGEIADNGLDDDHNGYVDDIRGYDFTTCLRYDNSVCVSKLPDNDPMDIYGHGTHVAGTIGAVGNNNQGVIGVAPRVKIMPLKGLSDSGRGSTSGLAEAIVYAAHNGADVINNSWGCSDCPVNIVAENAVKEAVSLGAVVVFSAGNNNTDVMTTSPANMKEVVAVAATDSSDNRASFSNYGALVDVAGPGVSITSTYPGNRYATMSGTSMAAPHTSGVAAVILSRHPEFTFEQVRQVLRGSLNRMDYLDRFPYFGSGRLDAAMALNYHSALNVNISDPSNNKTEMTNTYVVIKGNANGMNFKDYQLFYKRDEANQFWTPVEGVISTPVTNNILGTMDVRNLLSGKYLLRLEAKSTDGELFNDVLNFNLEKTVANRPPILEFIGNKSVVSGQTLSFNIRASDLDLDALRLFTEYPLGNFGGSFVDQGNGTGVFSWTPTLSQLGSFQVNFKVTDGQATDSELISINVTSPPSAINLVENGDFSPALKKSYWSGWGTSVVLIENAGYGAANSVQLKAGTFKRNLTHSLINVTVGKTYQLQYALKSTLTAGSANIRVEWRNINGFLISSQTLKTITTAQEWTVLTHDLVLPPKTAKVKIIFESMSKSTGEIFIDDVSLMEK